MVEAVLTPLWCYSADAASMWISAAVAFHKYCLCRVHSLAGRLQDVSMESYFIGD